MNFNPDRIADGFGGWVELKSGTEKIGLLLLLNTGNKDDDKERVEGAATILVAVEGSESTWPESSILLVTEGGCIQIDSTLFNNVVIS